MTRSVLLVFTNADGERHAEFNRWYDEIHLKEVLETPGFIAAERFELGEAQVDEADRPHRYLAIYEIEGDPADALTALQEAAPGMDMSATLHADAATSVFMPLTPRKTRDG